MASPAALTILFDERCALCVRVRDWVAEQRAFVPIRFVPCGSEEARTTFAVVPWLGQELVVVGDGGEVWAGAAAFLVALWALVDYRELSFTLSGPELAPLAERFFHALSSRRHRLAAFLGRTRCEEGVCSLPRRHAPHTVHRSVGAYR